MALAGCQHVAEEQPAPEPHPVVQPAAAPQALAALRPEQVRDDYDQVLRQALAAFERGDHKTALLFYERVLGRAEDPRVQLRALMCMAMLRMMPSSKVADPKAAAIVVREFEKRVRENDLRHEFFGEFELLRMLAARESELRALRDTNRKLDAQLAAKDELVRQLRALSVDGG